MQLSQSTEGLDSQPIIDKYTPVNRLDIADVIRGTLKSALSGSVEASIIDVLVFNIEIFVDQKVSDLIASFNYHSKSINDRMYRVRAAAAADRRVQDTVSRHREAEAIRLENSRLQEEYEKDVRNKSGQLADAQYMTKLLTKEIFFLMEKNTELGTDLDSERLKTNELQLSLEELSKQKSKGRITRRAKPRPSISSPTSTSVSGAIGGIGGSSREGSPMRRESRRGSTRPTRSSYAAAPSTTAATPADHTIKQPTIEVPSVIIDAPPVLELLPVQELSPFSVQLEAGATAIDQAMEQESALCMPVLAEIPEELPSELMEESVGVDEYMPALPPHLLPHSTFFNEDAMTRPPVVMAEEAMRIKKTIEDSRSIMLEVKESKSVSELIAEYNSKDKHVKHNSSSIESPKQSSVSEVIQLERSLNVERNITTSDSTQTDSLYIGLLASRVQKIDIASQTDTEDTGKPVKTVSKSTQTTTLLNRVASKPIISARVLKREMTDNSAYDSGDDSVSSHTGSSAGSVLTKRTLMAERNLAEQMLSNETIKSILANTESDLRECMNKLNHVEEVSERRRLRIEAMDERLFKLENSLSAAHRTLVTKDNTHTVSTHERDVLLRELSHQLYESRETIDALKKKLASFRRPSPMPDKRKMEGDKIFLEIPTLRLGESSSNSMSLPALNLADSPILSSAFANPTGRNFTSYSAGELLSKEATNAKGCSQISSKKGPKFYLTGPELLTSRKGTKLAVMRLGNEMRGEVSRYTTMSLNENDLQRLHEVRSKVVEKITMKSNALKLHLSTS